MAGKASSWSNEWGSGDEGKGKKMKAVASAGMEKAKAAAVVGAGRAKVAAVLSAQKVKSGTSIGIKWIKTQYQKRTSK